MIRGSAPRFRRPLLATVVAGILAIGGLLGATSASATDTPAAPVHATHVASGLTAGTPVSLPANLSTLKTIQPSFYVTPTGRRLTAANVASEQPDARAANIGVFYINTGQEVQLGGIHACRSLSPVVGGVTGIECADLVAYGVETNVVDAIAAGEGYCQTADGDVQCPAIKFVAQEAVAEVPGSALLSDSGTVECGRGFPACSDNGREFFTDYDANWQKTGCNTDPGQGNEFWTEVLPATIVALPGNHNSSASGNLGSPHAIICPNN
jgi:hypothetical protein